MNLRNTFAAAMCCGLALLLGCGPDPIAEPAPEAVDLSEYENGPLDGHRSDEKFDPSARLFLHSPSYFQAFPATAARVHDTYVQEFIRMPGAGFGRMVLPPSPASHWVELAAESQGERNSGGAGTLPIKYDRVTETLTLPDGSTRRIRERVWNVRDKQLMSVSTDAAGPKVYLNSPKGMHELMKAKKDGANAAKRSPDAFETEALAKLRGVDEVVMQSSEREMRVLGAIRARQECLSCHKVDVGAMLGAFSYTLAAQSEAIPDADRLTDKSGLTDAELGAVKVIESRGGKVIRAPGGPVTELHLTFARNRELRDAPQAVLLDFGQPAGVTRLQLHDSALGIVGAFPDVTVLDVSNSLVSNAGLKTLATLKHLKKLDLRGSAVSVPAVAALKKELPGCEVLYAPVSP